MSFPRELKSPDIIFNYHFFTSILVVSIKGDSIIERTEGFKIGDIQPLVLLGIKIE